MCSVARADTESSRVKRARYGSGRAPGGYGPDDADRSDLPHAARARGDAPTARAYAGGLASDAHRSAVSVFGAKPRSLANLRTVGSRACGARSPLRTSSRIWTRICSKGGTAERGSTTSMVSCCPGRVWMWPGQVWPEPAAEVRLRASIAENGDDNEESHSEHLRTHAGAPVGFGNRVKSFQYPDPACAHSEPRPQSQWLEAMDVDCSGTCSWSFQREGDRHERWSFSTFGARSARTVRAAYVPVGQPAGPTDDPRRSAHGCTERSSDRSGSPVRHRADRARHPAGPRRKLVRPGHLRCRRLGSKPSRSRRGDRDPPWRSSQSRPRHRSPGRRRGSDSSSRARAVPLAATATKITWPEHAATRRPSAPIPNTHRQHTRGLPRRSRTPSPFRAPTHLEQPAGRERL